MEIIDISPTISPRLAVWPGDHAFERQITLSFDSDHAYELSSVRCTVHLGAHADAPSHYHAGGHAIHQRPLSRYYGPCQVITVVVPRGERILPQHLNHTSILAPRVLFRTDSFLNPESWNEDFCSLSPELIHFLADTKVILVGIDTPSVDPYHSKKLESHQAIFERDLAILEGLTLQNAPDGLYTLSALPLKIEGADASPVRAALIRENPR